MAKQMLLRALPTARTLEQDARRKAVIALRHATIALEVASAIDDHVVPSPSPVDRFGTPDSDDVLTPDAARQKTS